MSYNPISVIGINGKNKIMNLEYTFRTLQNENVRLWMYIYQMELFDTNFVYFGSEP